MKKKSIIVVSLAVLLFVCTAAALAGNPLKLVVNGQEIKPDVPPQIVDGRTMVPVRWVAEALGAEVEWNQQNNTVNINTPDYISGNLQADSDIAAVVKMVEQFGSKLKNVSLLAPEDVVKKSIQENYGDLVSPALLSQWQNDLVNAPGRVSSSPWPERIEILDLEKAGDLKYEIKGDIIKMTSVEMVNGGEAGKKPVVLTAEKIADRWLITGYAYDGGLVYSNTQYGFSFSLPESWQGYSIVTDEWQGNDPDSYAAGNTEKGPFISIRHPQWTSQNPRQDIPIMIFTPDQWNLIQDRELSVGAAPIGPRELGRNDKYIFALPARYNFAFPTGYEEVETILNNNPLKAL